ncbi:MAG: hypothetical protein M3N13_02295, partial [Candidatus Eremiobacteraeota bacterium]|nr:hypothetical protein [Candidatus Eremiobacteraeota bacterium]
NSYGMFGSPRIEIRLVSPDKKTNVVAGIDSSRCTMNPTNADGSKTYSAKYCDIVANDGTATTVYSHLTNDFQTKYGSYSFATPPQGTSPVQLVVDPYTSGNSPAPATGLTRSANYNFVRVALGN